jgi:hypothetical protein
MTGKFRCQGIFNPQFGQWDAGIIIDLPIGIRYAQTFKKLPSTAPIEKPRRTRKLEL